MSLRPPSYCDPADRALYAKRFYSSDIGYNKLTEKEKEFCTTMYHMEEVACGLDGIRMNKSIRSEDSKNFIIKNCPCYKNYDNLNMNCIAELLGYCCQENKDCPIRITFIETLDENFEVEWVLQEDNQ